jgi:hypothetical protein
MQLPSTGPDFKTHRTNIVKVTNNLTITVS